VGLKNPWFVPINAILFYDFCLETVFCILTHYFRVFRVPEWWMWEGSIILALSVMTHLPPPTGKVYKSALFLARLQRPIDTS